jgi:hypothetical protein
MKARALPEAKKYGLEPGVSYRVLSEGTFLKCPVMMLAVPCQKGLRKVIIPTKVVRLRIE